MINGNVNEFVDNLYYGSEMYFIFRDKKYFIQGWFDAPMHYLVLEHYYDKNLSTELENFDGYICEHKSTDANECVHAFLEAPLWNGKTFYQVEKDIMWIDP